ncbi:hypothetical protein JRQ81_003547 [Phrynocephalus forsythii]|uniref:Uncharacterized protein n=1 Tax=Phrynocephalus forsythii TaxID=171643 RepID=A0A9Q1AXK6_9SAUR|nr:hypothetical protein JRQ81_003547 [Phrynocephalus forsythii]
MDFSFVVFKEKGIRKIFDSSESEPDFVQQTSNPVSSLLPGPTLGFCDCVFSSQAALLVYGHNPLRV